jgi:hypothetical protein
MARLRVVNQIRETKAANGSAVGVENRGIESGTRKHSAKRRAQGVQQKNAMPYAPCI